MVKTALETQRLLTALRGTCKTIFLVICIISFSGVGAVFARDINDVQNEIEQKSGELTKIQKDLAAAESELKRVRGLEKGAQGEMAKLQNEIDEINSTLRYNQLKRDELEEKKKLASLEIEEMGKLQDMQVDSSYISWKSGDAKSSFFGGPDIVKSTIYNEAVNTKQHGGILGIAQELDQIETDYDKFLSDSTSLQAEIEGLEKKKAEVAAKLEEARKTVLAASSDVSKIRTQSSALQSQIENLTKEQQELQKQEQQVINNNGGGGGGSNDLVTGEFYFSGQGRDAYQGHGVGMSQYGALGAALAGWDYKKITEFYFPGAKVEKSSSLPATINVDGVGGVAIEDYVAGAGEVPDHACEDLGVAFNPNNIWYCWPREAIKAQLVVYRTYGARRSGFVYRDTRGQVYKGGSAKKWGAEATKSEVVVYGGGLADVYYSSDNNQGKGNANNDTVWSNFSGDGTQRPYLKSVNDNSFAFKTKWTNWQWRTNSYNIQKFNDMLSWASTSSSISASSRTFMAGVKNDIGTLKSISFERDPSNRVKKVILVGDKGTRKIAGWLFKSVWNIWVGTVKPSGQVDYIYSLTFYINQK